MATETNPAWARAAILLARFIFAAVFILAATFKFVDHNGTADYIAAAGFPSPGILAWLAAVFELGLILAFLTGAYFSEAALLAVVYVLLPETLTIPFRSRTDVVRWAEVQAVVPVLLRFVAIYSLFDTMNIVFSFALRGAGDTRFVTIISLFLSWPIMVLPTWAAWHFGWGLYWAWGFASAYVIALGFTFLFQYLLVAVQRREHAQDGPAWRESSRCGRRRGRRLRPGPDRREPRCSRWR